VFVIWKHIIALEGQLVVCGNISLL